jgi:hypothetical protein
MGDQARIPETLSQVLFSTSPRFLRPIKPIVVIIQRKSARDSVIPAKNPKLGILAGRLWPIDHKDVGACHEFDPK